jgi:GTP cyclohydrolase IA
MEIKMELNQTNSELGLKVRDYLRSKGLLNIEREDQTPSNIKKECLEDLFGQIIYTLGLNPEDGNLTDTPKRLAKLYVNELFGGLDWTKFPKCTTVDNQFVGYNNFVLLKDIKIVSVCSHHFMPFFGVKGNADGTATFGPGCTIAYIPKNKVLGLSKFSRIVNFLGARPNTQETLTAQIAETISFITESDDVAIAINASHTCMSLRGAQDSNANTITLYCKGKFLEDDKLRKEFLNSSK